MTLRITRTPRSLALVWLVAAACSNLPPATRPASLDLIVEVRYEIDAGEGQQIEIPLSSENLTVLELETEPASLTESYKGRRRFLNLPSGPATVLVRCRYRIYAQPGAGFPSVAELFPGATDIRVLAEHR